MSERVRFKSRTVHADAVIWEVIKASTRSVDIQSTATGYVLYSVNRDRLETLPEQEPAS